jgi:hypothetical protein
VDYRVRYELDRQASELRPITKLNVFVRGNRIVKQADRVDYPPANADAGTVRKRKPAHHSPTDALALRTVTGNMSPWVEAAMFEATRDNWTAFEASYHGRDVARVYDVVPIQEQHKGSRRLAEPHIAPVSCTFLPRCIHYP